MPVKLVRGDITQAEVDAIVNAANNRFIMGGGVAAAIKRRGGAEIEREAMAKGPVEVGEAVYTAAGSLKAKYVIHAAVMALDFKTNEEIIYRATKNALRLARSLGLRSIAFPALGCGVGRVPYAVSARAMKRAIEEEGGDLHVEIWLYEEAAYDGFREVFL